MVLITWTLLWLVLRFVHVLVFLVVPKWMLWSFDTQVIICISNCFQHSDHAIFPYTPSFSDYSCLLIVLQFV
jgi:hypothetical protein